MYGSKGNALRQQWSMFFLALQAQNIRTMKRLNYFDKIFFRLWFIQHVLE